MNVWPNKPRFTLFCREIRFVLIYALLGVKFWLKKSGPCKKMTNMRCVKLSLCCLSFLAQSIYLVIDPISYVPEHKQNFQILAVSNKKCLSLSTPASHCPHLSTSSSLHRMESIPFATDPCFTSAFLGSS